MLAWLGAVRQVSHACLFAQREVIASVSHALVSFFWWRGALLGNRLQVLSTCTTCFHVPSSDLGQSTLSLSSCSGQCLSIFLPDRLQLCLEECIGPSLGLLLAQSGETVGLVLWTRFLVIFGHHLIAVGGVMRRSSIHPRHLLQVSALPIIRTDSRLRPLSVQLCEQLPADGPTVREGLSWGQALAHPWTCHFQKLILLIVMLLVFVLRVALRQIRRVVHFRAQD